MLNLSCTGMFLLNIIVLQLHLSQQDIIGYCRYTCLNRISTFFSLGSIIKVSTAILHSTTSAQQNLSNLNSCLWWKITQGSTTWCCSIGVYCSYGLGLLEQKFCKTRHEIWHKRGKSGLKGQSCVILYIISSFKFL